MRRSLTILIVSACISVSWASDSTTGEVLAAPAPRRPTFELADVIYPYEPTYFLLDVGRFNAKFQVSVSARAIGPTISARDGSDRCQGLYVSYSQTSFWDLGTISSPFFDTSYRPEVWWHQDGLPHAWLGADGLDLQGGFGHESNGQGEGLSRSMNKLFIRPVARWGLDGYDLRLRPRFLTYVFDMNDNPDMADYRGYADLEGDLTLRRGALSGLRLSTLCRIGRDGNRGSMQIDLSYPFGHLTGNWFNLIGYAQFFDGWSETLRTYDERSHRLLVGFAITR
jgi:outer membrane phospholipase A